MKYIMAAIYLLLLTASYMMLSPKPEVILVIIGLFVSGLSCLYGISKNDGQGGSN